MITTSIHLQAVFKTEIELDLKPISILVLIWIEVDLCLKNTSLITVLIKSITSRLYE